MGSRQTPHRYQIKMCLRKPNLRIYDPIIYDNVRRIRKARGLCKQTFDSQIENLMKHDLIPWNGEEVFIRGGETGDLFVIQFAQNGETTYHWWLDISRIEDV